MLAPLPPPPYKTYKTPLGQQLKTAWRTLMTFIYMPHMTVLSDIVFLNT